MSVRHEPMIYRNGSHFWLTCCDWRHDPASNDPDDNVRWAEWRAALDRHLTAAADRENRTGEGNRDE